MNRTVSYSAYSISMAWCVTVRQPLCPGEINGMQLVFCRLSSPHGTLTPRGGCWSIPACLPFLHRQFAIPHRASLLPSLALFMACKHPTEASSYQGLVLLSTSSFLPHSTSVCKKLASDSDDMAEEKKTVDILDSDGHKSQQKVHVSSQQMQDPLSHPAFCLWLKA